MVAWARAQNTTRLAASTTTRLDSTERSRSFVASYWSSWSRVRRAKKRAMVPPARPHERSSLAGGGASPGPGSIQRTGPCVRRGTPPFPPPVQLR